MYKLDLGENTNFAAAKLVHFYRGLFAQPDRRRRRRLVKLFCTSQSGFFG